MLTVFRDGQVLENVMRGMVGRLSQDMTYALYPMIQKFCVDYDFKIPDKDVQWLILEAVKQQTKLLFDGLLARAPSHIRRKVERNSQEFAECVLRERTEDGGGVDEPADGTDQADSAVDTGVDHCDA